MAFYDSIAPGYDELYAEEQRIKLGIIKENLDIKNNDLLLDVGCGTGLSSDFDCEVIGIDPSMELLQQSNNNENDNKKQSIIKQQIKIIKYWAWPRIYPSKTMLLTRLYL